MTLSHLESRMHACRLLDSGAEYKQALLLYVKRIADEGFRGKAEEVVKELCGPVYLYVLSNFHYLNLSPLFVDGLEEMTNGARQCAAY